MKFPVYVKPGSARDSVGGSFGQDGAAALVVRVRARAVDGAANKAVIRALAVAFDIPVSSVRLVAGAHSRRKLIEADVDPSLVLALTDLSD